MTRLQRGQKLVEKLNRSLAEATHGRMEINGMNRNNRGNAPVKTSFRCAHAILYRERWVRGRRQFHVAIKMQHAIPIDVRRSKRPRAILSHANSISRPGAMCVAVGAVTRSASRPRQRRK